VGTLKNPTRERIMRNLVHNDGVYKVLPFTAFLGTNPLLAPKPFSL